ncbi:MAG: hypothetical protein IPK25_03405 [Saprospiraceae bacterium]|nr:hypothetical protein [Saprospiraceae bacterium]
MDNFFSFPSSDKNIWLQKVTEDVKGKKNIEEFFQNIDGITIDPFYTEADLSDFHEPLDRLFEVVERGLRLNIDHETKNHEYIKRFLECGASALQLDIKSGIAPEDLLSGIFAEYIFMHLICKDKDQALLFSEYMENQYKDKSTLTFIQVENKIIYPLQTIICDIDVSKEVIGPLSIFLKEAEEKIQEAKPYRCILNVSIGKNFLLSISTLRAIRILWENLVAKQGFEGDIPAIVTVRPEESELSSDPNQCLIEMSYLTLSALIGNVDVFYGTYSSQETNHLLNILMMQHVFIEEGKLDTIKDPLAGSYIIEQITHKIVEQVWKKYLEGENSK